MKAIAVDVGGTFTDVVVLDQDTGEVQVLKVPSTPTDPSRGVLHGVAELAQNGLLPGEVASFSHGTTVGTNLLVQGKGARVGLLVTQGLTGINDVWQVPRFGSQLSEVYVEKQPPVLPRFRAEVRERVDAQGRVLVPLDVESATQAVRRLGKRGVESIAVVLIFSFLNPQHERKLAEIIRRELPGCAVSLSSEILPQIREYPRLTTTVANALLTPAMSGYLSALEQGLHERGVLSQQLYIMQSNGGVAKLSSVQPVTTILSGPSAGALAGMQLGRAAGFRKVVSLDMGGTSTDIALGEEGQVLEQNSGHLGDWEIGVPMLRVHSIGAGGGTIAWLDKGGSLQVGPQSAGADPGPVCYDRGGAQPTITDANLLLGFLAARLLGGRVLLRHHKAQEALAELGRPLGFNAVQAASGMVRIINAKMEEGIRAVSTELGYDLREFALVAFGGAGPVHAAKLASELGIPHVVVPPYPGLTSALGLLMADPRRDYVRSRLRVLTELDAAEANALFGEMRAQALREFSADGFAPGRVSFAYFVDLRYLGQGYELTVPTPGDWPLAPGSVSALRLAFDGLHQQLYGHSAPGEPVEAVNFRLRATASVPKFSPKRYPPATTKLDEARTAQRQVLFEGEAKPVSCPIYDRSRLSPGHQLSGPAIVEQLDATTVIYPGQRAHVDEYSNLVITASD